MLLGGTGGFACLSGLPNYTYMKYGPKLVGELAALSYVPVYIRAHHLLCTGDGTAALKWGSTNAYTEDSSGKPVYDWRIVDRIIDTYKTPVVNVMELGLVGAVLYHALNGLRIMAIDFWEKGPRYQKHMSAVVVGIFVAVMAPGAYFMLEHTVRTLFGSTS